MVSDAVMISCLIHGGWGWLAKSKFGTATLIVTQVRIISDAVNWP